MKNLFCLLVVLCASLSIFAKEPISRNMAELYMTPDLITLQPEGEFETYTLTISGPSGIVLRETFSGMHMASFEPVNAEGDILPDGSYTFEMIATPVLSGPQREAMLQARASGDYRAVKSMHMAGPMIKSGHFTIKNGYFIVDETEPRLAGSLQGSEGRDPGDSAGNPTGGTGGGSPSQGSRFDDPARDQVILDDLIVDGSLCVGFDCVNGESFSFDTIRLKENNLRIRAQDTSTTASFPGRDWQITFNDSANGGLNKFSIDDIDGGRTPFTIEGNAPSHSLYVDDGGRLGLGTSIPVSDIHVVSGNTPTLRLEQNGSSGFAPQTWDVAGNETNFFIRDATNGSTLPLRIFPSASSSTLTVHSDGVGFANASPNAEAHVTGQLLITATGDTATNPGSGAYISARGDGARIFIDDTQAGAGTIPMTIRNNGRVNVQMVDVTGAAGDGDWSYSVRAGDGFSITRAGSGVTDFEIDNSSNVVIQGTATANGVLLTSDRNAKKNFQNVDSLAVLDKVLNLPISTWQFKDRDESLHMGPMAQDFYSAFGLGSSDTTISMTDSQGVALSAIQGLNKIIQDKDAKIEALTQQANQQAAQLAAQEARLKALEAALLNQ